MKVLVLEHRWDTPDNEGSDIQIFGENNIEAARLAMQESVEAIKEEYESLYDSAAQYFQLCQKAWRGY